MGDGFTVGVKDGIDEGLGDGFTVGVELGSAVGSPLGPRLLSIVGGLLGALEATTTGAFEDGAKLAGALTMGGSVDRTNAGEPVGPVVVPEDGLAEFFRARRGAKNSDIANRLVTSIVSPSATQ